MKTRYALFAGAAVLFAVSLSAIAASGQNARVQLVNASVEPMMETVDVYLDDVLWYDDFEYAAAKPFTDVVAGSRQLALAPASSASSAEAFRTLEMSLQDGQKYHAVLAGVLDPGQYEANPEGRDTSLKLFLGIGARETSSEVGAFEVRSFDALITGTRTEFWVREASGEFYELGPLSYGEFSPVFTHIPEQMYGYHIPPGSNYAVFYNDSDFAGLAGQAFLSVSIGFIGLDACTPNTGLPDLRWLRIFPSGEVVDLVILCTGTDTKAPADLPEAFRIQGNYPNPFNPVTTVQFDLSFSADVRVDVFDLLGRRLLQIPEQSFGAGSGQQIRIDASDLGSGIYLYRVMARSGLTTYAEGGRMILLK